VEESSDRIVRLGLISLNCKLKNLMLFCQQLRILLSIHSNKGVKKKFLQEEIETLLKKVDEYVIKFDSILNSFQIESTTNQKEKWENDLKKAV